MNEGKDWKYRSIAGVVYDMYARKEDDCISYFTQENRHKSYIEIVDKKNDVYLRTKADDTKKNNLDELDELSEDEL